MWFDLNSRALENGDFGAAKEEEGI